MDMPEPTIADAEWLNFAVDLRYILGVNSPSDELSWWQARLTWPSWDDEEHTFPAAMAEGYRLNWADGVPGGDGTHFKASDVLDDHSAEVGAYACIFNDEGEPDDAVFDSLMCEPLYIATRVHVEPRLRGHHLGPFVLAAGLFELSHGEGIASCQPAPYDLADDDPGRPAEQVRLERIWAQFGFSPLYEGDIWTMELTHIEDTLRLLRKSVFGG